jgi:hypothetical protein
VPRIAPEQLKALSDAIHSHDFLHRLWREIEHLQRVVFHSNERADWKLARASAEQILMAELFLRHKGNIDGVYFDLRKREGEGKNWAAALREYAGYIHAYFTTPLGIVMRRDLFGDAVIFLSPDATEWAKQAGRAGGG